MSIASRAGSVRQVTYLEARSAIHEERDNKLAQSREQRDRDYLVDANPTAHS
ncbi:MAG: hypothetical protein AB7S26_01640 [Sandaracinaceae bacterium]